MPWQKRRNSAHESGFFGEVTEASHHPRRDLIDSWVRFSTPLASCQ